MALWVPPSFLGTPSTPYPRRPKGTKMQISFKKVKPAAKGKAKAPVKKKTVQRGVLDSRPRRWRGAPVDARPRRANPSAGREDEEGAREEGAYP
jgi:hypothetical protein